MNSKKHNLNIAIIVGVPTLIDALALARQHSIRLDYVYHAIPVNKPLEADLLCEICRRMGIEYRGVAHISSFKRKGVCLENDLFCLANRVDCAIVMYRTIAHDGESDYQVLDLINPRKVLGMLDGLCINLEGRENKFAQRAKEYFKGNIYISQYKLNFFRRHVKWIDSDNTKPILTKHIQAIRQITETIPRLKRVVHDCNTFFKKGPYNILLSVFEHSALGISMEESVVFFARAARALLEDNKRLYIKLHPRDIWGKRALLTELLAQYGDRLRISNIGDEGLMPIELLTEKYPPACAYMVGSTTAVDYTIRNISVCELYGEGYPDWVRLNSVIKGINYDRMYVNMEDVYVNNPIASLALHQYLKQDIKGRRIIFGFGKYGKRLLIILTRQLKNNDKKLPALILDDKEAGKNFGRWTVLSPDNMKWKKGDVVFLATDTHEQTFRQRLADTEFKGKIVILTPSFPVAAIKNKK